MSHKPFALELERMSETLPSEGKIPLWEIEDRLPEQGAAAFIAFLTLPFLFPMPIPGISTALGLAIFVLSRRLSSDQARKLPAFLGAREINVVVLKKIVLKAIPFIKKAERFLKPRLKILSLSKAGRFLCTVTLCHSAVALALPIPPVIPLSNTVPAVAILFIALGIMEDDGILLLLGHIFGVLSWIYFLIWWEVIVSVLTTTIAYAATYLMHIYIESQGFIVLFPEIFQ